MMLIFTVVASILLYLQIGYIFAKTSWRRGRLLKAAGYPESEESKRLIRTFGMRVYFPLSCLDSSQEDQAVAIAWEESKREAHHVLAMAFWPARLAWAVVANGAYSGFSAARWLVTAPADRLLRPGKTLALPPAETVDPAGGSPLCEIERLDAEIAAGERDLHVKKRAREALRQRPDAERL